MFFSGVASRAAGFADDVFDGCYFPQAQFHSEVAPST
jgi:hypothetical protein